MEKSFAESLTGSSRATLDVVADSPDAASQDSDEELADLEKELQYICRISVHVSVDDPVIHAPLFHANITRITAPANCFIHTDRLPSFVSKPLSYYHDVMNSSFADDAGMAKGRRSRNTSKIP